MVESITQQGNAHTGQAPQQQAEGQVARHAWLHRRGAKLRWVNHLPGNGALGDLQAEIFPCLDVGGEVGFGHIQLLLEGVIFFDQLGVAGKILLQGCQLSVDFSLFAPVLGEARIDGILFLLLQ